MAVNDILIGLSSACGPAGAEGSAARLGMELLGDYAPVRQDALGNVIAELGDPAAAEHILLDAHIDEIGMVVTGVDDCGFLRVDRCGGADRRVLPGAEVLVFGKRKLPGIVCCIPPHLSSGKGDEVPEWDKIAVDVGFAAESARELVPPGSRIIMRSRPGRLIGERVCGKALDNRAGAAALIRCVQLLDHDAGSLKCRVSVLLSVQEEVSGAGAGCAAFSLKPTQAIAVDVGFALQPGVAEEKCGKLGKGPMIGFYPVLDGKITERLTALADSEGISWQYDVGGGTTGTNADSIAVSGGGVRCGLVSIPQRNMHTPAEIVDCGDIEDTARLLAAFIRSGGAVK